VDRNKDRIIMHWSLSVILDWEKFRAVKRLRHSLQSTISNSSRSPSWLV